MDNFLSMLGDQVMKCAIRSGIALTSTLAINQSHRLLHLASDHEIRNEYKELQEQFDSKIKVCWKPANLRCPVSLQMDCRSYLL